VNRVGPSPGRIADSAWEARLLELLAFRSKHGHVNVPRGWVENSKLAVWVLNQRRFVRRGTLREDRRRRLEQCGIVWAGAEGRLREQQETWSRMHGALRAFKQAHGHLNVPRGWPTEPSLAGWLASQRFLRKKGDLLPDRELRLAELEADWYRLAPAPGPASTGTPARSRAQAWDQAYAALEDYARHHGTCAVPNAWPENPRLARWVVKQRLLRKRGLLSPQRVDLLARIGFEWSGEVRRARPRPDAPQVPSSLRKARARERIDAWERSFAALADFAKRNGHVDVPDRGAQKSLARWVNEQRRRKQVGALSADRVRRLEALGMGWSLRDKRWNLQYARLQEYRRRHGHCNVPTSSGDVLSRWVSAQRSAVKAGRLSPERRARLAAIGFAWSVAR
jgi:hypothetical protein